MKKALIIGSARSGNAVSRLLHAYDYTCTLIDEKKITDLEDLKSLGINCIEGSFNLSLLDKDYDLIVKNPGIPHTHPFVLACEKNGYFIYTEIEIASWFVKKYQYAAITGTNGKTSTTELLQAMLKLDNEKNCAAGNVGLPLSELVLKDKDGDKKVALEIAAFQLLGIKNFHPKVSVILNLAPDHLDVFKDVQEYYLTKTLVYKNQKDDDWFLRNVDDENILKYANPRCKTIDFSLVKQADLYIDGNRVCLFDTVLFYTQDLKIKGLHNIQNAMVAACCGYKLGVSLENIQKAIKEFKGVEHRIEFVKEVNGIEYYNDSKATTAESTKVALSAFDKALIVLVGGYDKKTGFDNLKDDLKKCKSVIAFGETKQQFKDIYSETIVCENMKEAFDKANEIAQTGDVVLLSPACASYDQFKNYEERGNEFKAFVSKL